MHQQALTERMAQGAHHTIDRLSDSGAPHVDRLEEAVSGVGVRFKGQAQRLRESADEWADRLRATVRRKPLTAVATALAIGALMAHRSR